MNQHDATLAAEALAAECLALRSEVARLRGVIEAQAKWLDAEAVLKSDVKGNETYVEEYAAKAAELRAALSQPVQGGGE